jgi:nucleotide-binding universal stress UspA family protein
MIKPILVATDGSEYGSIATRFRIHLAQKLNAHLTGLHVLDSRLLEGPLLANISGWIGANPYGDTAFTFQRTTPK